MAEGDEYLGRVTLRHELTAALLTWGGHIGYAVRPSARRRGHASAALHGMLGVAGQRGIDPVLVRLGFVVLALAGGGGVLAYLVAWLVIPEQPEGGQGMVVRTSEQERPAFDPVLHPPQSWRLAPGWLSAIRARAYVGSRRGQVGNNQSG